LVWEFPDDKGGAGIWLSPESLCLTMHCRVTAKLRGLTANQRTGRIA
jgi:hypothetical protein